MSTNGTLGVSVDGTLLGSEEGTGTPATVTILSVGSNTVTVSAPTLVNSPAGYNASGQQLEVSYTGLGLLSSFSQVYTTASSSFGIGSLALSSLLINNRIDNPNGFDAGTYTTKTVVTCS